MTAITNNFDIPSWRPDLICKYDVAGPRYTSYPSAAYFRDAFNGEDYRQHLRAQPSSAAPISLYIHLPFCRDICYYCACNKVVTRQPEVAEKYLGYLIREMDALSGCLSHHRTVTQLHLGGGTPTYLTGAQLTELMHQLACRFRLTDQGTREYSIEIDPRSVQPNTLALLKGLGFNRLSLGVQDFDSDVQHAVNRVQPYERIRELVELSRSLQFRSINFDLIYGLPVQTPESLSVTLDRVVSLAPDRISFYNYAHLPEQFKSQRAIDRLAVPDASVKFSMLSQIVSRLLSAGYRHIGMDHFVRPDDDLARAADNGTLQRNFQGYSTRLAPDLIGLGVSAISSLTELYAQNARTLEDYYQALDRGMLPVDRGLQLSKEDILRRDLIMRLICQMSLIKPEFEQRYSLDFDRHFSRQLGAMEEMAREGLLVLEPDRIRVTGTGRFVIRNICMLFDQYLENSAGAFSRTI